MRRPAGVTVIAIIYIVGACFLALMAIVLIVGGSLAGGMLGSVMNSGSRDAGAGAGAVGGVALGFFLGAAGGILLLLLGSAHVFLAWGMLKLKEWARIVSIVLAALGVIGALIGLMFGVFRFAPIALVLSLVRLAIAGIVLWYLTQPSIRGAFRDHSALPVQI